MHAPRSDEIHAHSSQRVALAGWCSVLNGELRRGTLLVEVIVSLVLLAAVFRLLVPTLGVVQKQRRYAVQRQTALDEASNVLESVSSWPWEQLTRERLDTLKVSDSARRLLPDAEIRTSLMESEAPSARQIMLEIQWRDQAGNRVAPVRLACWIHRRQEERP